MFASLDPQRTAADCNEDTACAWDPFGLCSRRNFLDSAVRQVHAHLDSFLDSAMQHDAHPIVKSNRNDLLALSIDLDTTHTIRALARHANYEFVAVLGRDG